MLDMSVEKNIEGVDGCTGCGACFHLCPNGAISMRDNEEGFSYPEVDALNCTDCALCRQACPVLHPSYKNEGSPPCFAAQAADELRLAGSSSGAFFPVLSRHILKAGGVVCGAAFSPDMLSVRHIVAANENELQPIKGSKYIQSRVYDSYAEVKEALNRGVPVLFTGTPCQIAGLYAALGADHELLLTADLVCHGVPPAKVFRKYIEESFPGENLRSFDFRDKSRGWKEEALARVVTDKMERLVPAGRNSFMKAFSHNLDLRPCCGRCLFNKIPRQADLSMGDLWGMNRIKNVRRYNDGRGTSVITANNLKGRRAIESIKNDFIMLTEIPLKSAVKGNRHFVSSSSFHPHRKYFFRELQQKTLEDNVQSQLAGKCDVLIFNFWFGNNYGAILTSYALYKLVQERGLSPQLADCCPEARQYGGISERFANEYFQTTPPCRSRDDLTALNKMADTFIVGSDQVWRQNYNHHYNYVFFLDFIDRSKKKIACSVSFGLDRFDLNESQEGRLRGLVKEFDYISVREEDGLDICQNTFGVEAQHLPDPVFALDRSDFELLAEKSSRKETGHIFSYCLSNDGLRQAGYQRAESFLADKLGRECLHVDLNQDRISVEDWLYLIKSSTLVLTDSFHGLCLAIIFNKPFIALDNQAGGSSRYKSLFRTFGLTQRLLSDPDEVRSLDLDGIAPDYARINEIINHEKDRFADWLTNALSAGKDLSRPATDEQWRYLTERIADLEELGILLARKNKIYLKYYRYKLLSLISWGAKRKKYLIKRARYKALVQRLRTLPDRVGLFSKSRF